ncbi:MAG: hypothetical protein RLZZ618_3096 [Pseudomonadota bacterium]|jgi:cytoskeletal protein CcmA (bactofilin family)
MKLDLALDFFPGAAHLQRGDALAAGTPLRSRPLLAVDLPMPTELAPVAMPQQLAPSEGPSPDSLQHSSSPAVAHAAAPGQRMRLRSLPVLQSVVAPGKLTSSGTMGGKGTRESAGPTPPDLANRAEWCGAPENGGTSEVDRAIRFQARLDSRHTLVVPAGATVHGHFEARCVHIQGTVHGRVSATEGCLVIDVGATVIGSVQGAGTVVIAGRVRGQGREPAVSAAGTLRLAHSARINGCVHYTDIEVYAGAKVVGPVQASP